MYCKCGNSIDLPYADMCDDCAYVVGEVAIEHVDAAPAPDALEPTEAELAEAERFWQTANTR